MRSDRHDKRPGIRESPWRITRVYVIFSLFWIIGSYAVLSTFELSGPATAWIELAKGVLWVLASAVLLHILVFRQIEDVRRSERAMRAKLVAGEELGQFGTSEWLQESGQRVWSEGMFRIWGADPTRGVPGFDWLLARTDPEDAPRLGAMLAGLREGRDADPLEIRIRRTDGQERLLRLVTRFEEGTARPVRGIETAQDVTDLRAASREARTNEAMLRAVLESSADGLVVVGGESRRILVWNQRYADLLGVSRELLERGDALDVRRDVLRTFKRAERVEAWMDELYQQPEAACIDLVETLDGKVLERTTAPVYLEGEPKARLWAYRDVTDRIRSVEELRRREHHLRVSQEIAKLGSFEWDLQRNEIHWSDELFRIYGFEPQPGPVTAEFARERRHPDDRERMEMLIRQAVETGHSEPATYRIIRPDGETRWLRAVGELVEREPGRKVLFGAVQDVTERERAAEALREAEERYRAAFEQAAVGIAEIGADLRLIRMNPQLLAALGYTRDELTGMSLEELTHPDEVGTDGDSIQRILAGILPSHSWLKRYRRKDGSWLWAEVTMASVRTDHSARYLIAVVQDVSERKAMESERLALANEVQLLLQSSGAGLIALDRQGRCRLANRAASEILGYSVSDLLGTSIYDLVQQVPGDGGEASDPFTEPSGARVYDRLFRRRDGRLIPCDVTVTPIAQEETELVHAVSFVDVSERNLLEAQLERAERLSSLGRLAASIAHEMNNVLMGILPFAEIVSRGGEGNIATAGDQIRQSVRRGRSITQEILRFTRPAPPEKKRFAVDEWILGLTPELEEIVSPRARWNLRIEDPSLWIEADPSQLGQIVSNLVMNARDAVAEGTGNVTLTLGRAPTGAAFSYGTLPAREHDWVHLEIRDDGTGMDAETLRQLFEPFFTTKRGGTGLGLPIAQKLVYANEAILFVESTPEKGSAFHLFFPERRERSDQEETQAGRAGQLPATVLLVEDDETVAAGIMAGLEFEGVEVRLAGTGTAAIDALATRPGAMILDVGLPDMDGSSVCGVALEKWPDLPIVFSTGHGDASRLGHYLDRQNVRFLMKPYSFEELWDAIVAVAGGRHPA